MFFCSETNFKEFASPLDAVRSNTVGSAGNFNNRFAICYFISGSETRFKFFKFSLNVVVQGYLGRRMNLCHKHEGTHLLYQRQPVLAE